MDKRGMSGVLVLIIILALSIIAIGIFWVTFKALVTNLELD